MNSCNCEGCKISRDPNSGYQPCHNCTSEFSNKNALGKNDDQLNHWYCFSYTGTSLSSKKQCNASTYTGYLCKKITKEMIQKNKARAGVDNDSVLISCSYLGFMTRSEFTDISNKQL